MRDQIVQQLQRDLFFIEGIATDRTTGRQVVATLGDDDARPQHARRVEQIKTIGQHDALLNFGDTRLVAGFGGALAGERVDQRRLADVGNAADQHAHGLDHAAARRSQHMTGLNQGFGWRAHAGVEPNRTGARLAVVVVEPKRRARRVGQVLLVQHFQGGLALGELRQHGVGAGARQACVQQLDHDINFLDPLADGFFGQVHVTGKPLNSHLCVFFL